MFQAVLDALLEAWEAIWDYTKSLLTDYIPIDWDNLDVFEGLEFVADYLTIWDSYFPLYNCIAILGGGLVGKYSIRGVRWIVTFIPTIGGG